MNITGYNLETLRRKIRDLQEENNKLKELLKKTNIIDCGICSVCNSDLIHSFRVEKETYGLETALIELID